LVKELQITYPDLAWVSDITYIRLESKFIYLAMIMVSIDPPYFVLNDYPAELQTRREEHGKFHRKKML